MDISNITDLTTLKAMAYDEISKVEQAQKNLQLLNQQITTVLNGVAAVAANPKFDAPSADSTSASEPTADADATDDTATTTTTTAE